MGHSHAPTLEMKADEADMGVLRVEVVGAKNLMAGDRSGKSDVSPLPSRPPPHINTSCSSAD